LGITCKQFLAKDGVHYEPRWFEPWPPDKVLNITRNNETIPVGDLIYELEGISVGFEICEDAWHKTQRPGYRLYGRGVDLILNPSASHFAMGKSELREYELVCEGTSKFQCAYVFANLLGNEAGRMIYDGDIIIGQHGRLIAVNERFSFKRFNVLAAEIDFGVPANTLTVPSNDVKERNEELTRAVSLGLYDYLRKSRAAGFVLSLSGGADSATCAILVAEMVRRASQALGWNDFNGSLAHHGQATDWRASVGELLTCAYQSTRNSSKETLDAAIALSKSLGAGFHHWSIDDEALSFTSKIEKAINRQLTWETDDIALQNIQARTRSPIIWLLANIKKAVLLTTSNRSEGDVGYATMDGDTSGSFGPIAGLSKTFILQWLQWAESSLGHEGLQLVNSLQPTAELRPAEQHQTDESDLMPYDVLTEIERHAIQLRKSPIEVFYAMEANHESTILKQRIGKFFRLWAANQWKRERLAPAFHLDDINVDPRTWCRFPILSSGFSDELAQLDNL
jgi:NAD+ synthase (glutamine-hydrolysing)